MPYDPERLRHLSLSEAAPLIIKALSPYLKPRPLTNKRQHFDRLIEFFGTMPLKEIHIGPVNAYQRERRLNTENRWPKPAGPSIINHELSTLADLLDRAGEWNKIKPHFKRLRLPSSKVPIVLTDDEERLFFSVAESNPDWEVAVCAAGITRNTGASGTELRHLQHEDIHIDDLPPWFYVKPDTAKNEHRGRVCVMNTAAAGYMRRLLTRATRVKSHLPKHYILPWRDKRRAHDPTKPCSESWLKKMWHAMRNAAGFPWLQPHHLRHQFATLLFELDVPPVKVSQLMGHKSTFTALRVYNHTAERRKRDSDVVLLLMDPGVRKNVQSESILSKSDKIA